MHGRWLDLPTTPRERRDLLASLLQDNAQAQMALSFQHREFTDLSDEDVASLLVQLAALGVDVRRRGDGGDDPERSS